MEEVKKILITGAQGMLGSALCETLSSHYQIIAVDKDECDITDREKTLTFFRNAGADIILHCAAYTDVDRSEDQPQQVYAVNVEGTANIIEAIKGTNCLLVYISTDYVFDGTKKGAYIEPDLPHPLGVYGYSKLEGEKVVQNFPKHLIVRTSWLFGPRGKNFVATIASKAKEKEALQVVDDQVGSPTYTRDLAKALAALLDLYCANRLTYGIYHVTNSGQCSWFEFAKYILSLLHSSVTIKPISSKDLNRKAKRPLNSLLSNEKFYALSGFFLPSWQEAVKHYIEHCM
ncbi:MAG: dTDP-4-dehydrorhamnose reductase [Candidatus Omnitrophota bacterium]